MQKDFKIGAALGLLLIAVVSLWLAVQPSLNIKARMTDEPAGESMDIAPAAPSNPAPAQKTHPQLSAQSIQPKYRIHVVCKGENLSMISKQYYGSATKWQKILEANGSTLKNPNSITPGTKLIIPD